MNAILERCDEKETGSLSRFGGCRNYEEDLWARGCAVLGTAVWAGIAVLARMGIARIGAIELMFLFAPLVIVPIGMELGGLIGGAGPPARIARRLQPVGAGFAVVAMLFPPGRSAAMLACGWLLVCLLMAGEGVVELVSGSRREASRSGRSRLFLLFLAVARIDLAVAGAWLVASRLGMRPMGIQEPIGLLTAVHFHFAGFATATMAAATLFFAENGGQECPPHTFWLRRLGLMVIFLPFAVAAGFVISPVLKMVAAGLFSASVAALAVFVRAGGRDANDPATRVLLQVAAGAVFAGMVLAGTYVVADYLGSHLLTIPQMARTHGVLNALGFCLCGLLGWMIEGERTQAASRATVADSRR